MGMIETSSETVTAIREQIASIAREILRAPELEITGNEPLRDQLGLDSADLAELLVTLEERTGVALQDDALAPKDGTDPLATVDSLATLVAEEHHAAG